MELAIAEACFWRLEDLHKCGRKGRKTSEQNELRREWWARELPHLYQNNTLAQGAGAKASLTFKTKFQGRPHHAPQQMREGSGKRSYVCLVP